MKILIGLSGGLDSTYAAYLLKAQGHEVVGASVIMHEYTDVTAATLSAKEVGIEHITVDMRNEFKKEVIAPFASDYSLAKTPNPCVNCNPNVKFKALCKYAEDNGFDRVATGHYSYILNENGRYFIRSSSEGGKDQSYVLWKLTQNQLSKLYLPLAGMKKSEIKDSAQIIGLSSANAADSQEICFIPNDDYVSFVENTTGKVSQTGNFIDKSGNILGKHQGLIKYTVGQRKGLGISFGEPMFVASIDASSGNILLVPSGEEYFSSMCINELSFMKLSPTDGGSIRASVKVRYSAKKAPCRVEFSKGCAHVTFEEPVRAVAPGQSAVFYDNDDILFGGIIMSGTLI